MKFMYIKHIKGITLFKNIFVLQHNGLLIVFSIVDTIKTGTQPHYKFYADYY